MNEMKSKKINKENLTWVQKHRIGILNTVTAVILILGLFLGGRILINEKYIKMISAGNYEEKPENLLLKINFPEGYLPYFNIGNMYYKAGKYDDAIISYKKSLNHLITKKRECPIRVNLALAMIKKIDFENLKNKKDIDAAIMQLRAARNILTAKGCADPDGTNGHDKNAEQLKENIDAEIKKLEEEKKQQNNSGDDQNNQNNNQNNSQKNNKNNQDNSEKKQSKEEKDLQNELEKQQKDAADEQSKAREKQNEGQNEGEDEGNDSSGNGDSGVNGFQGKTW